MATLNKVFLIGNLTKDPEIRYTPSGTAVANLRLAVNHRYTNNQGEKVEEPSFFTVIAWARQAEICGEYLHKGSPLFVEGRLRSRSWDGPDGQKRYATEVVANNVQFLGKPSDRPIEGLDSAIEDDLPSIDEVELGDEVPI